MSHFFVNTDRIRETEDSLGSIPGKMQGYSDDVVSVRSSLDSSFNDRVFVTLSNISESLIDKAARMDSFKSALALINEEYIKTENLLTGNYDVINGDGADSYGTDKRSWWDQFWDWVFNKDIDREYTNTTKEQEDAADQEMQAAIQSILAGDERFSEDYWKNASVDERKQILTDYMNQVKAVMGLSSLPATITWTNTPPNSDGTINKGAFSQTTSGANKHIEINEYYIQNYPPEKSYALMTTIVHELRHGYQHAAVENPTEYRVSQETIDSWKESFRTYAAEKAKGYEAYRNIVVEKDARWFAGQS